MYKDLLPLGSVVQLKGGQKRVMICSRVHTRAGEEKFYDYAACLYPEGIISENAMIFFNHDTIERIFSIGFQDEEEWIFHREVLDKLDALEIRDGKISLKNEEVKEDGAAALE